MSKPTVDALMAQAFYDNTQRTPRSAAYREGVRAALRWKLERTPMVCPYVLGTAEADAWFAGTGEGRHIARGVA